MSSVEVVADETINVATPRPPFPPFTRETAIQKVRLAEDGWNTRNPERVALAYSPDSRWRNRAEFANGRAEIIAFLKRKWSRELDYRLIKSCGPTTEIVSRCASHTSGMTTRRIGFALTETRTGNSMTTD